MGIQPIVQTIVFTVGDVILKLPPPMKVQEVEKLNAHSYKDSCDTMEATIEDVEARRVRQAAAEAEMVSAAREDTDNEDDATTERAGVVGRCNRWRSGWRRSSGRARWTSLPR